MKSIMDYGMGVIFLAIGLFFLFGEKLHINIANNMNPLFGKFFGVMCVLYGTWRFYRGYKKNYFR
ncbi:MAG TPA: hypothetical protein VET23_10290 [Chitinophagaceae bacterium]|nr:hypothetical protein [Chitinophagaceae bacterium]